MDPVSGGFDVPTAKGNVSWLDSDTLLVSTTADGLPATSSSYARTAVKLRRGESLDSAEQVFEIPEDHMLAMVAHDSTPGYERTFAVDYIDFYNRSTWLGRDGSWLPIDVPTDVNISAHREWLMFRPQQDWTVDGTQYPAGSLLAADLEAWLSGAREVLVLFTPDEHTSLQSWSWTRDYLLLNLLHDVSSEIRVLDPSRLDSTGSWASSVLDACPPLHDVNAYAVDDEDESGAGNDYWLVATGFTTPTTLTRGSLASGEAVYSLDSGRTGGVSSHHEEVKRSPSFFNESDYEVQQHFAVSADGTRVPYFQVASKDLVLDGQNPTQLSGYGGFEVSRTPAYSGSIGRAWLERRTTGPDAHARGGVYVVANIRGGGEFGPGWHQAAIQAHKQRSYDDFIAVAEDLVARGVTTPRHLGIMGGSNGGLLVGAVLTQRPDLFHAVVCQVPLLDMKRFHKLLAGASWIAEYGDPDSPRAWEVIARYSPYQRVSAAARYPQVLFITSTRDDRVHPGHARKMAERMRTQGHDVLYYENIEGGHGAAADAAQRAHFQALELSYLWSRLALPAAGTASR